MSSAELRDNVPPHNDEAERATLGAIMLDPESFNDVTDYVRAQDFYKKAHQQLFSTMVNLDNTGKAIDLLTVTEALKSQGELEQAGGTAYVSSLTSSVPSSANVGYYAQIVQDCSIRRTLIRTAHQIIRDSFDESHESRELIETAEKHIYDVTDQTSSKEYHAAGEIISHTIEAIEQRYKSDKSFTGVPSGFDELDAMTGGFQNQELIVIGARPSVGKSALALSMAANMAFHQKISVGFFSLEMPEGQLMERLLASEAKIGLQNLRHALLKPADFHPIMEAAAKIYEAPLYIEDTPYMKLLDLRAQARRMKSSEDIQILFIDYITLIKSENMEIPRHEQIAEISRSLKALSRELDIPIVVLSQVKRETEGKRPVLSDIRESGSIEQDADMVMFLHREQEPGRQDDEQSSPNVETELIIAKHRNGPIGQVDLAFVKQYARFDSLAGERS